MRNTIDLNYTYLLIQNSKNQMYRLPLAALDGLIIMNNDESEKIKAINSKIDELSAYILELSAEFTTNYYSIEEISADFEMKADTIAMSLDKEILSEEDITKYIKDSEIKTKDEVETAYDKEDMQADSYFMKLDNESDSYFG